jgi:hypothetical protein
MTQRLFIAYALFSCIAFAQATRKPGLWETSSIMQVPMAGVIPPDRLAAMTPEQRAQFQAMMSSRAGRGAQPVVSRSCETPQTIAQAESFLTDKIRTCKVTPVSTSGSRRVVQVSCDTNDAKSEGTLTIDMTDSEHYNGSMVMNIFTGGRKMEMSQKMTGKWLGANCGDVKPRQISN